MPETIREKHPHVFWLLERPIALALIVLIPSLIGIGLAGCAADQARNAASRANASAKNTRVVAVTAKQTADETKALSVENAHRIAEIQELRAKNIALSRATDRQICESVNALTRRIRAVVLASAEANAPLLRKLGYTDEQVAIIVAASRENAQKTAKTFTLIAGGDCSKLPNQPKAKMK